MNLLARYRALSPHDRWRVQMVVLCGLAWIAGALLGLVGWGR